MHRGGWTRPSSSFSPAAPATCAVKPWLPGSPTCSRPENPRREGPMEEAGGGTATRRRDQSGTRGTFQDLINNRTVPAHPQRQEAAEGTVPPHWSRQYRLRRISGSCPHSLLPCNARWTRAMPCPALEWTRGVQPAHGPAARACPGQHQGRAQASGKLHPLACAGGLLGPSGHSRCHVGPTGWTGRRARCTGPQTRDSTAALGETPAE